ncbi:MAG: hypothetical protein ABS81_30470 [Pseudonocardia sp. SCN 72-86]|nr:MAG: hypothetical protein ABS81_30470 [Pseudonocardia sp. SCN 72-86]
MLIGVAAWLVASVVVVLLLGRMIRARDAQVPRGPAGPVIPQPPKPVDEPSDPPAGRPGRGHQLRDR